MDHPLALRQHLKELFRARLRKETPADDDHVVNINAAYSGQFFGPSETLISDRVIALLRNKKPEKPDAKFKVKKSTFKRKASTKVRAISNKKMEMGKEKKLKFLKEARDYSCLWPEVKAGKISRPEKSKETKRGGEVPGPEVKAKKISRPEVRARKISRPEKKEAKRSSKVSGPEVKARQISGPENPEKRRSLNINRQKEYSRKINPKETNNKGKAMVVAKSKQSGSEANHGLKRKRDNNNKEEVNPFSMIRRMFRYDPTKYGDDRDDDDDARMMEASFRDIEKEERRSAKIARKEDAEELRKLMTIL